jgi:hypothetical protein
MVLIAFTEEKMNKSKIRMDIRRTLHVDPAIIELYSIPERAPLAWESEYDYGRRYFVIIDIGTRQLPDIRHVLQIPNTDQYRQVDYNTGFSLCKGYSPIYVQQ